MVDAAKSKDRVEFHLRKDVNIIALIVLMIQGASLILLGGQALNDLATLKDSFNSHLTQDAHLGQAKATAQIQADLRNLKEDVSEAKADIKEILRKVD